MLLGHLVLLHQCSLPLAFRDSPSIEHFPVDTPLLESSYYFRSAMSLIVNEQGKVSPPMVALPGPHYRNNPHPRADFLIWRAPRKQWPMKEAEKKPQPPAEDGALAKLKAEERVKLAKAIKEAKTSGVFHQGAVFCTPKADKGRHWSIHPEWPIA